MGRRPIGVGVFVKDPSVTTVMAELVPAIHVLAAPHRASQSIGLALNDAKA